VLYLAKTTVKLMTLNKLMKRIFLLKYTNAITDTLIEQERSQFNMLLKEAVLWIFSTDIAES
jgi:hypothetical protein